MTEDFKIYTKDYIAGSVIPGEESDAELFYGSYSGIARIYEDYDNNAIVKCVKQVVSPKNVGVMWTILVLWSDTLHKGRFVILDENNEIISTIDQYTSEVNIGCYYCIDLDEKGRLYGIEWFNQERVRFIMLNNVSVPRGNEYYADIRKTYDIPTLDGYDPTQSSDVKGFMVKKDAKYGIALGQDYGDINVYSFEINVDSGNVWKHKFVSNVLWVFNKPFIKIDSNNYFTFKIIGLNTETHNPPLKRDVIVEDMNSLTLTTDIIMTETSKQIPENCEFYWIDENNILVPFNDINYNKFYLQKLNLSETAFTQVYEEDYYTKEIQVKFASANNYCFLHVVGKNYNAPGTHEEDEIEQEGFKQAIYHIFNPTFSYVTQSNNIFEHIIEEVNTHNLIPDWFGVKYYLVQNQYNLYNHIYSLNVVDDNNKVLYIDTSQEIYNENNYNGAPYYSNIRSSCIPQQFILKNGDKIYYARDIYNKTAYGNIVDASLQIPNNLINDVEINNEQLWGIFKIVMNNENKTITKNKYEELILTIRNKLNIIDNNDGQNTLLPEISERVGKCMAEIYPIAYGGVHIKYAKINYQDNTTENIATTISRTDNVSTISFNISVSKEIDSIDLISKLGYKYVTITPTLEIGKTYNISQDVRIGE